MATGDSHCQKSQRSRKCGPLCPVLLSVRYQAIKGEMVLLDLKRIKSLERERSQAAREAAARGTKFCDAERSDSVIEEAQQQLELISKELASEREQVAKMIEAEKSRLSTTELAFLRLRYVYGIPVKDMTQLLGCTKENILRVLRTAEHKL